jgi:hypothetical protein
MSFSALRVPDTMSPAAGRRTRGGQHEADDEFRKRSQGGARPLAGFGALRSAHQIASAKAATDSAFCERYDITP